MLLAAKRSRCIAYSCPGLAGNLPHSVHCTAVNADHAGMAPSPRVMATFFWKSRITSWQTTLDNSSPSGGAPEMADGANRLGSGRVDIPHPASAQGVRQLT